MASDWCVLRPDHQGLALVSVEVEEVGWIGRLVSAPEYASRFELLGRDQDYYEDCEWRVAEVPRLLDELRARLGALLVAGEQRLLDRGEA